MSQPRVEQRVEGSGDQPVHEHGAMVHAHDHYHVTHHHGGLTGEFQHRTSWHTHEHNHASTRHSHDYDQSNEEREHAKEAHIHDHASPDRSPS